MCIYWTLVTAPRPPNTHLTHCDLCHMADFQVRIVLGSQCWHHPKEANEIPLCKHVSQFEWFNYKNYPKITVKDPRIVCFLHIDAEAEWPLFCRNEFPSVQRCYVSIKISLKFISKGSVDNMSALVHVTARCRTGDKPLREAMKDQVNNAYQCVTRS